MTAVDAAPSTSMDDPAKSSIKPSISIVPCVNTLLFMTFWLKHNLFKVLANLKK
jgi:hypothetical protein